MPRYTVRYSEVQYIGYIWQPGVGMCAQSKTPSAYDVENIRALGDGQLSRDGIEQWLSMNTGDFQSIEDFSASIEDGPASIDIPWQNEESQWVYADCMDPDREYETE